MKKIRIPIPAIRWLTISWGEQMAEPAVPAPKMAEHTGPKMAQPLRYGKRGRYSLWLKETGKHRKAWEKYYQIDRQQMDYLLIRCGHKAPFSQQEIMEHSDIFKLFLEQRTDPETRGRGRPRLRSV